MNDLARHTLCALINQYGCTLADDPRRCEALLRDFCGQHRREIRVLVNALKEGVVASLLVSQPGLPPEILQERFIKQLQQNLSMTEAAARWAVESWAIALGVSSGIRAASPNPVMHQHTVLDAEKSTGTINASSQTVVIDEKQISSQLNAGQATDNATENGSLNGKHDTNIYQKPVVSPLPPSQARRTNAVTVLLAIALAVTGYGFYKTKHQADIQTSQSSELRQKIGRIETALIHEIGENPRTFWLENHCSQPIEFTLKYRNDSKQWDSGTWSFAANQESYLDDGSNKRISLGSPIFYYYAETPNKNHAWTGDDEMTIDGKNLSMRLAVLIPNLNTYTLSLSCNN